MVDIRIFDQMEECTDAAVEQMLPLVSAQRREQALAFKFTFGRFACLKSYLMLAEMTGLHGFTFNYNEHGKPSIAGHPEIHFNISHCQSAIAVAVSDKPIGIDIESYRDADASLIRHVMNPAEAALIEADADPRAAFIRLWTQKEAVLKLRGTGIIDNLQDVLQGPGQTETHSAACYAWSVATL